jgi:hypothetical protein
MSLEEQTGRISRRWKISAEQPLNLLTTLRRKQSSGMDKVSSADGSELGMDILPARMMSTISSFRLKPATGSL